MIYNWEIKGFGGFWIDKKVKELNKIEKTIIPYCIIDVGDERMRIHYSGRGKEEEKKPQVLP